MLPERAKVAALELAHPEAHKLRAGIIAAYANYSHTDDPAAETARLRAALDKYGYTKQIQMVERALTTKDVWAAQPGAAAEDVLSTWHQLVALHHKAHALFREKKDAELALAQDSNEANFAWLKDVSARLEFWTGPRRLLKASGIPRAGPAERLIEE